MTWSVRLPVSIVICEPKKYGARYSAAPSADEDDLDAHAAQVRVALAHQLDQQRREGAHRREAAGDRQVLRR